MLSIATTPAATGIAPHAAATEPTPGATPQLTKLLPVPYVLVTFTLPHTLNAIARSHHTVIYDLLFTTSADALQTLALNPEWLGGTIGMVGVLHAWDRAMGYHVHVHYLVPTGGIDPDTGAWIPSHPKFLVPASALREVFRAKFRDALYAADPALFTQVPPETWSKAWVVHGKAVGDGRTALTYLAPYVARVALSNQQFPVLPNDSNFCLINAMLSSLRTLRDSKIHKNYVIHFLF